MFFLLSQHGHFTWITAVLAVVLIGLRLFMLFARSRRRSHGRGPFGR